MSEMSVNAMGVQAPSKAKLMKATAVALAVAVVILFTAVLPAEYGIDPLGTGKALGLNGLAASSASAPTAQKSVIAQTESPVSAPNAGDAPVIQGTFAAQPNRYKVDSRELKLEPGEGLEIKYHMQKGAGMIYSWTANQPVAYEFHGEPDVKPAGAGEDYYESYDLDDKVGKNAYNGTFTSPSTGIQGWFWENKTDSPVTIKLVTAGFYDYILQNKDDIKTKLQPSDPK
jgi:hypothetical protein